MTVTRMVQYDSHDNDIDDEPHLTIRIVNYCTHPAPSQKIWRVIFGEPREVSYVGPLVSKQPDFF